jgi:hypothetical protein
VTFATFHPGKVEAFAFLILKTGFPINALGNDKKRS